MLAAASSGTSPYNSNQKFATNSIYSKNVENLELVLTITIVFHVLFFFQFFSTKLYYAVFAFHCHYILLFAVIESKDKV